MATHAGSMTIHNKNCTKTYDWGTRQRVKVHIYSEGKYDGCTEEAVTVRKGHTRTIELIEHANDGDECGKYAHEAMGTAFGDFDIHGGKQSSVTCKKDWLSVCQCTKD